MSFTICDLIAVKLWIIDVAKEANSLFIFYFSNKLIRKNKSSSAVIIIEVHRIYYYLIMISVWRTDLSKPAVFRRPAS